MPAAWSLLSAAPRVAVGSIAHHLRPCPGLIGARRLAVVRAAVLAGTFAVLTVEFLGAAGLLTRAAFTVAWLLFLTAAGALLIWAARRRAAGPWSGTTGPSSSGSASPEPDRSPGPIRDRLRRGYRALSWGERLLAGGTAGLVLVELIVALLAEPNNYDSQTYHLPKVEHWVGQGGLDAWPTAIHRQVTIPPGAEYLLLHLRLLTGGDQLYNLVQWAAMLGCLLVATRITAQLGGGRRAQLITAFALATTPMVALQATSTQTDLVVAAWAGCVATLVLDGLRERAGVGTVLAIGAATGLTAVTKTSGLIAVGPLLVLWGVAQLRQFVARTGTGARQALPASAGAGGAGARAGSAGVGSPLVGVARVAGASVLLLAVAVVVVGPYLARMTAEFGHPLGPPRLRESIPMQRHDPPSVLVNALRIGHTALDTPLTPVHAATATGITGFAELIGVDPQDRATTFGRETFPVPSWYPDEDRVAFPLAGAAVLIAAVVALVRPTRLAPASPGVLRAYAATLAVTAVLHPTMLKWQPWGNRLLLYALVLAVPLAGLWLDALLTGARRMAGDSSAGGGSNNGNANGNNGGPSGPAGAGTGAAADPLPRRRPVVAGLVAALLATSALAGVLAVGYGFPRRLVGTGSLLTTSDWDTRFLRRPQWAEEFRWAAEAVRARDAHRIGLVQQNDNWEYPWWLLLRDSAGRPPRLVALQSVVPGRPPADPASVDAIVCTGSRTVCTRLVPPGWQVEFQSYVGYALPPS